MSDRAPPPPAQVSRKPSRWRRLAIIVGLAVLIPIVSLATVIGLLLPAVNWAVFRVPSGSMIPSLLADDYFLVDKQAYNTSVLPRRGDIILFYTPATLFPQRALFLKRVIGVPGDRVQLIAGVPSLTGVLLTQEALGEFQDPSRPLSRGKRIRETLPGGVSYDILKLGPNAMLDDTPVFVVPAGTYFVMGDNRDDSLDSRSAIGPERRLGWYVPLADIIGQAKYVYWSGFGQLGRIGTALK